MASFEINVDMILEILSHSHVSVVEKSRLLNKEFNKRTYSSSFLKQKLQNTNSVSGYFIQYNKSLTPLSTFIKNDGIIPHGSEISLDFLPPGRIHIKACDASHGVLCVLMIFRLEEDIPSTWSANQQRNSTRSYRGQKPGISQSHGLVVMRTDPLRYKIISGSRLPTNRRYNLNFTLVCDVFDSDSFAWKRLSKNVELPAEDMPGVRMSEPVAAYEFLHWLTANNNVLRFCLKTDTWSFLAVPEHLASEKSLKLANTKGSLGFSDQDRRKEWIIRRYGF
ncbi:unnamed protein product [Microthlaspi erraticum]|uniref:F-box associated domain-containing protein n=1 Tax=Microthlaspi erraticum TaxID=1685480 RepID=A0A6D2HNW8_9BRAS|nr:unnamed protein product [Microthlaspi erraticum]